jgi:glucose-6-phosphate dehydrogenase assembly protein OpcA
MSSGSIAAAASPKSLEWIGRDVAVSDIARELSSLREATSGLEHPVMRTSVMTHVAWVPSAWAEAALATLEGLGERHPSRTIVLLPEPDASDDRIDAVASLRSFEVEGLHKAVSTEVVKMWLRGERAFAPASVVAPLLVSDLPVFVRWRGEPPFGADELDQLVDLADRLVVDSSEWKHLPRAYGRLTGLFDRSAVSDIAWRRSLQWRRSLALLWPDIAQVREVEVTGPKADALLLGGWLRSRLAREVRLQHEEAATIERIVVDGTEVETPPVEPATPSDLLSGELDTFGRDPVYEGAVEAAR